MDEKSKEIQELRENMAFYDGLLKKHKKGDNEDYSCRDVANRITWHRERMICIKALKGNVE